MTTFEERYRKKSVLSDAAQATPHPSPSPAMDALKAAAALEEYRPYHSVAHPELELWIRPNTANEWTDIYLPYTYRNHMISDGNGFVISMHFSTPIVLVTIHGRNLQELTHLLSKRQVEWVMEYDPRKWGDLPLEAPCITGIEIHHAARPGKNDAMLQKTPEGMATH